MAIVSVAIATPLMQTFDYLSEGYIAIGMRVEVSFSNRICIGIVLANPETSDYLAKLKPINKIIDDKPIISKSMLNLLSWLAKYCHHPIGEVVFSAVPKNIKLGKKLKITKPIVAKTQLKNTIKPNITQQKIIDVVLANNGYQAFLLNGITGSGKTEVYLRISQQIISQGKQVLILVPEIGLTPQMIHRFSSRLKTPVAAIHSQLSESQKLDSYLLAKDNKVGVILGTRSAIFSPANNLGIIIIDEEHDGSFKQQSNLRYSAKNLAFIRAKQENIPLLLGSATPSLETLANVINKKIQHLMLKTRAGNSSLPSVNMIDMSNQNNQVLSNKLITKISYHIDNKKQVMLFINRRGYAPIYHCQNCNWQAKCVNCSANMVLHNTSYRLQCHHCNAQAMPHDKCPKCGEKKLLASGYGTQRLEEMLYAYFPKTDIVRIDRDTTRKKKSMQTYLDKIATDKPCIIIGTQMLAKGHDFANLAMVGILDADVSFFSVDFRATEHLAQLLMQVAGRAGRSDNKGEVYIQSRQIDNKIFAYIKQHNYIAFAKLLLAQRKEAILPPYSYQALISANSKNQEYALDFLIRLKKALQAINSNSIEILGPANAIVEKKASYYYVNLYLSSTSRRQLHQLLNNLHSSITQIKNPKRVRWFLDVDPI